MQKSEFIKDVFVSRAFNFDSKDYDTLFCLRIRRRDSNDSVTAKYSTYGKIVELNSIGHISEDEYEVLRAYCLDDERFSELNLAVANSLNKKVHHVILQEAEDRIIKEEYLLYRTTISEFTYTKRESVTEAL